VLPAGDEDQLLSSFQSIMAATASNHPALQQLLAGTTERMLALVYSAQQSRLAGLTRGCR